MGLSWGHKGSPSLAALLARWGGLRCGSLSAECRGRLSDPVQSLTEAEPASQWDVVFLPRPQPIGLSGCAQAEESAMTER